MRSLSASTTFYFISGKGKQLPSDQKAFRSTYLSEIHYEISLILVSYLHATMIYWHMKFCTIHPCYPYTKNIHIDVTVDGSARVDKSTYILFSWVYSIKFSRMTCQNTAYVDRDQFTKVILVYCDMALIMMLYLNRKQWTLV